MVTVMKPNDVVSSTGYYCQLKTELQSLGVAIDGPLPPGRAGGAGPAEGITVAFGATYASVPAFSGYARLSPYRLKPDKATEQAELLRLGGEADQPQRVPISFPVKRDYFAENVDGIPVGQLALLHGVDCLASTVIQECAIWSSPKRCQFCGIGLSLARGHTTRIKSPEQLAQAAAIAQRYGACHVTLTSGSFPGAGKEFRALSRATAAIKAATGLPVQVQILPPHDTDCLQMLRDWGADTVGIHVESFDGNVWQRVAPYKAELGLSVFWKAWEKAVDIFGPNQVISYILVGLGEDDKSILEGVRQLAEIGVYPFVVPFRPIPGTNLGNQLPPPPERMHRLYLEIAGILNENELWHHDIRAGCGRCISCSALPDYQDWMAQDANQ